MFSRTNLSSMILLLLLVLAACAAPIQEPSGEAPTAVITVTPAEEPAYPTEAADPQAADPETSDPDPLDDMPVPPAAYLTAGGATQEAGIGSYCWGEGAGTAVCADMMGIPTWLTALKAGPLASLVFDLPLDQAPEKVLLAVSSVTESERMEADAQGWQWWSPAGFWNQFTLSPAARPEIELALPPGLNLLSLFVRWADYGDVSYGFLVEVEPAAAGPASSLWTVTEDPRTGLRFAAPCFWRADIPQLDPSGLGAFPVVNHSAALAESTPRGVGLFDAGGLKIDFNYLRPSQLGLPAGAPLAEIPPRLMGEEVQIQELAPVEVNGQAGLLVSSYNTRFGTPGSSYLFSLEEDLVLLLGLVPGTAIHHPDIRGIVHSLALSDQVAVQRPDWVPAGPLPGDGPYACLEMAGSPPPEAGRELLDCPAAADSPEALACQLQTALLDRDMAALERLMADPVAVGYWRSEGLALSPAELSAELGDARLPADTSGLAFSTDRARFPDLDGMPAEGILGPERAPALIIYSQGWGADGRGEALLYLGYDQAGELRLTGLLLAMLAFD